MSDSLAKIWARKIRVGTKKLSDVEEKYGDAGVEAVKRAYFELYGESL